MPTLKEFVNDVLVENNIIADQDQIIKSITQIARGRAVDGCCAISDEEVRNMVINNVDLANRLTEEKKAKEKETEEDEALRLAKVKEQQMKKQLEKERQSAIGVQTSLFGD